MNYSTIVCTLTRGFRFSAIAAILALLTGLLAVSQPARADTIEIVVKSPGNSGTDTLREAIDTANNNPGDYTIKFDADFTDGIPILLSGLAGDDDNLSGDLDILDAGDLTIEGNGAGITIIDGYGNDRVFHICPGGGCTNTVTIRGVTIQNGKVTIIGGGGIRNKGGTTIVDSSTIRENSAPNGGGIANFATLTIQNGSTIGGEGVGNQAVGGNGGGIYNYAGTLTVDHSTVSANTAGKNGGGIWSQVTLNVQNNSTIGGPDAGNEADYGGGIFNKAGITTVDGSIVSDNKANRGGGIYNIPTLIIQNGSTIGGAGAGNEANWGGGIYNQTGSTMVDGSTVSVNTANNGGGIYNKGTLNIQNSSTIGGADAGNEATVGGGIYNQSGTTKVNGSTVRDNKAVWGGGINNDTGGTTMVDAGTVSANSATFGGGIFNNGTLNVQKGSTIGGADAGNMADYGGGIYNREGTATVDGSTISDNEATYYGGGIYNLEVLTTVHGSTLSANTAINGGGIFNWDGTTSVNDSTVSANTAENNGGGIYNRSTLNVQNGSAVSANTSKNGGGIYNQGTLDVTNSTIGGGGANQATIWGGGIFNYDGDTTVTGSCILNNRATIDGGGLYIDENSLGAVNVTGSSIAGNSEISFCNKMDQEQTATGNWWGAATGPNSLGADTVDGNVNTSYPLTETIPGCLYHIYLPVLLK